MKYKKVIIILALMVGISFLLVNNRNTQNPIVKDDVNMGNFDEQEIVNDDFVLRVMKNDLQPEVLKRIYSAEMMGTTVLYVGPYDDGTDRMLIYKDGIDKIKLFQNNFTEMLVSSEFTSNKLVLDGDILVGVNKEVIEKKFNVAIKGDKLVVTDFESTEEFIFHFENNILKKIEYNLLYLSGLNPDAYDQLFQDF